MAHQNEMTIDMIVLTPDEMAALDAKLDAAISERDAARAEVDALRADARLGAWMRKVPDGANVLAYYAIEKDGTRIAKWAYKDVATSAIVIGDDAALAPLEVPA